MLFCDARPGAAHGCVAEFAAENADTWGTLYPDLASLLDALTTAIIGRTPFLRHSPFVAAGRLDWRFNDEDVETAVDTDPLPLEPSPGPHAEEPPRPHDESGGYLVVTLGAPGEAIDQGDGSLPGPADDSAARRV